MGHREAEAGQQDLPRHRQGGCDWAAGWSRARSGGEIRVADQRIVSGLTWGVSQARGHEWGGWGKTQEQLIPVPGQRR